MKRIVVGITGASGALLAERTVRHLLKLGHEAEVVISASGAHVFREELKIPLGESFSALRKNFLKHYKNDPKLRLAPADDFAARVSSGSAKVDAMVIVPCSMSTLCAIANGITMNLIHRAAGVTLKERRPLVLVPRESPLSPVHLKHMQYLAEIGVHIVPATTAFYHRPRSVEAMVDFTVGRVFDLLKIEHRLFHRWREKSTAE